MDSIRSGLQDARGGKPIQQIKDQETLQPTSEHRERLPTSSAHENNTTARRALPTGRPANNYDAAPPSQPGLDPSAKPPFTRGISVIDQTAVTSAAPTPAGEISNPMSFGMGQSVSRQRESHLPDLDLVKKVRAMSTVNKAEPVDAVSGEDESGPGLSRQETEKGR
ncbi:unnamed protein product [Discula destructiva]